MIEGENALVEIKCVPSAHRKGNTLEEHATSTPSFCLKLENGHLRLKKNHSYYFQVQGQLNICGKDKCFFIVYIDEKSNLFWEEIQRDEQLWTTVMLPKLRSFYKDCILPEILEPQVRLGKNCKDPEYIIAAQQAAQQRKRKTLTAPK